MCEPMYFQPHTMTMAQKAAFLSLSQESSSMPNSLSTLLIRPNCGLNIHSQTMQMMEKARMVGTKKNAL